MTTESDGQTASYYEQKLTIDCKDTLAEQNSQ